MKSSQVLTSTLSEVKAAEDEGQYELAFQRLSPFWDSFSQFPNAIGLSDLQTAELFLRCGGVIGFLGNTQKISNAQEISKNLLSQARQNFVSLSCTDKAAECENYLALAYSRTGEYTEAFDWLSEAYSRPLPAHHPVRIHSHVVETLLLTDSGKYERVITRSSELGGLFAQFASDSFKGCFHNHLAMAYENLGKIDEALYNLEIARNNFEAAGHEIFYGTTENNLALLFKHIGRIDDAHKCAVSARQIFERIGDKVREGFCLDTRAQIFAAESELEKALTYVNSAIDLLESGESYRKLVDSYRTKIGILFRLGRYAEALTTMTAAHNLASLYISQDLSRAIIEDTAGVIEQLSVPA